MPGAVRGDFGKLDALIGKLRGASRGSFIDGAKRVSAAEALTQIRLGFRGSRDPYGNPWQPLKRRQGRPLEDTGRLRASFSSTVTPTGFSVGTNVQYAGFHQDGTRRIPRRAMLPWQGRGMGKLWTTAINRAVTTHFRKFFRT